MASLTTSGIEGLSLSMAELAKLPDEVIRGMLLAQGEVVKNAQQAEIGSLGLVHSGKLQTSIAVDPKYRTDKDGVTRYINVYPKGTHHTYAGRMKTKVYKVSKHGRTYSYGGGQKTATDQDVGFVQEFGSKRRGIARSEWMKKANEKAEAEAERAAMKVYENYLNKLNL